jgi:hypothetical protein
VAKAGPLVPGPAAPGVVVPSPLPAAPEKLPRTTSLGVAYEALPPERTGIVEFKIGQYKLAGGVAPFAIPSLVCGGLANCVEPAGRLDSSPAQRPSGRQPAARPACRSKAQFR